jgi:DNA recombination protein RmuC
VTETLTRNNQDINNRFKELSLQVEKRLAEGFDKTTATFTDIVKRLALIDDAQKKLTELSSNVVSLQEILVDKRSRGAFGEVQLKNLVQNMLPVDNFAFQHTLSNQSRADCILFLPEPTGNIVIDSKFPLENFQLMTNFDVAESDRKKAHQSFKQDIKKHITDISSKYILKGETSDGAIMFIPAEAVFAEIHAHFPDLVEFAHRSNVWLTSPTTLMAILTTAQAVLKDSATREHIHVIQEHLRMLANDFSRFESRMQNLAKHIDQAQKDVQQVHTSARKITSRFNQIERCEVGQAPVLLEEGDEVEVSSEMFSQEAVESEN